MPEIHAETAPPPPSDLSEGAEGEALPSLSKDKITPPEEQENTRTRIPKVSEIERDMQKYKQRNAYIAKQAHAICENAETLFKKYGKNRIGFLTMTFRDDLQFQDEDDWKEASKRWDSINTHLIKGMFEDYMLVKEPQSKGRIHFHLLVACKEDIRSGFDFQKLEYTYKQEFHDMPASEKRKYWSEITTSTYLKGLWATFREKCPKYGFGRHELLPIKKEGECVSRYVGKYLELYRIEDLCFWSKPGRIFSGRRVTYSQGWKTCSMGFVFAGNGHKRYREAMQKISDFLELKSEDDMKIKFGVKWGWKLRAAIREVMETGEISQEVKTMLRFQAMQSVREDYREIREEIKVQKVDKFEVWDKYERPWRFKEK